MDPAGQGVQTTRPDNGNYAQNGQADGADGQTGHGGPGLYSGLGAQLGREDQIACSEEHGEQGKANQQLLFSAELLHRISFAPLK